MKGPWFSIQVFVPVLCLFISGCSTSHKIEGRTFADDVQGAVTVQNVDDASFQAAHPVSVSPQLLAHILHGAQSFSDDANTTMHVFSDDETRYLSHWISKALFTATKNQLVTFRVLRGKSSEQEALGGTIYIQGRLLHFALTYYHTTSERRGLDEWHDDAAHHPGELEPLQLAFIPETDQRPRINGQRYLVTPPPLGTLVIDYKMFGDELGLPSPTAQAQLLHGDTLRCSQADIPPMLQDNGVTVWQETPSHITEETQALKELVCEQAIELDALKRDMRVLRHTLSEIEERVHKSTKPKLGPPLQSPIPSEISAVTIDPSCNPTFASLHCKSRWFFDTPQEEST